MMNRTFGCELEYEGISQSTAAKTVAEVTGGTTRYVGGSYGTWEVVKSTIKNVGAFGWGNTVHFIRLFKMCVCVASGGGGGGGEGADGERMVCEYFSVFYSLGH